MIAGLYECFKHWSERGTVWLYSDPHFNDKDLKYRPTDEDQIKSINSKVGKYDTIIFLGDIGDLNAARQIRGYKVLVAGNHDPGLTAFKEVFNEVYGGPLMIGEKLILSHEPIENISWAFNIHGHVHDLSAVINRSPNHFNCCAEAINYTPINFNQWMREGHLKHIQSIHRATIDRAARKKGRRY